MKMLTHEWPLAGFTLLTQFALGAVLVAALLPLGPLGPAEALPLARSLLLAAAPALAVGLLLSLYHLGSPLGALRALANLRTSWLSREILCAGLFAGLTLATALGGSPSRPLLGLTVVSGLATVYAMGRLYQATIMPAWRTLFTPLSFFTASLMLGVAAAALLADGPLTPLLAVAGAGVLALQLGAYPFYTGALSRGPAAGREALSLLAGPCAPLLALRIAAGLAGVALLAGGWAVAGAICLGLAEVLARLLFYALGLPIRVG